MAHEILLIRTAKGLQAYDAMSDEIITSLPFGKPMRAKVTLARNVKHNRKMFALLKLIFDQQSRYPTLDHLLTGIKLATGHYDEWKQDGATVRVPKSISFDAMDQTAFSSFYDRVIDLVCTQIIPGLQQDDLAREIEEIIGSDVALPKRLMKKESMK